MPEEDRELREAADRLLAHAQEAAHAGRGLDDADFTIPIDTPLHLTDEQAHELMSLVEGSSPGRRTE